MLYYIMQNGNNCLNLKIINLILPIFEKVRKSTSWGPFWGIQEFLQIVALQSPYTDKAESTIQENSVWPKLE